MVHKVTTKLKAQWLLYVPHVQCYSTHFVTQHLRNREVSSVLSERHIPNQCTLHHYKYRYYFNLMPVAVFPLVVL